MTETLTFNVLQEIKTPSEPDVLLFSPIDSSVLIAGTYHLQEDGSRIGSLLVYHIDPSTTQCRLVQEVTCNGAVLDIQWHTLNPDQLIVALSTGAFSLYSLWLDLAEPQLRHIVTYNQFESSTLVLSLAVEKTSANILATLSTGHVAIANSNHEYTITKSWKAHDLEVWCSAWKAPSEVLTGGDDAMLKLWDVREVAPSPSITCKSHDAGVVSILPISESVVLTGSYDNSLRVFDYRNLRRPVSSVNLDGGVWRILPRPKSNSTSFLACCMQSGARTVMLNHGSVLISRGTAFEPDEERRLIYGASWHDEDVAALCSFYERKLYVCKIP